MIFGPHWTIGLIVHLHDDDDDDDDDDDEDDDDEDDDDDDDDDLAAHTPRPGGQE